MAILDSVFKSAADSAKYAIDSEISDLTREAIHSGVDAVKKGVGDATKKSEKSDDAQNTTSAKNNDDVQDAASAKNNDDVQDTTSAENANGVQDTTSAENTGVSENEESVNRATNEDPMLNHNRSETLEERANHADKGEFKTDGINNMNNAFGDMLKTEDKERLHEADEVAARAQQMVKNGESEDGSEVLFQNADGTTPTDEATQMKNMVENVKKMSGMGGAVVRVETAITGDGIAKVGAEMAKNGDSEEEKKRGENIMKEAATFEAKGDLAADQFNATSDFKKSDSSDNQ